MTDDTSAMFQQHSADVPRDRYGRYLLPDESGDQIGWTRATTFAATLAEAHGLRIWEQRQVVWGLGRRPDLVTLASTIVGPEDKKALGAIVDSAHEAAGTQAKANRGTAAHAAIQRVEQAHNFNGAIAAVPDELHADVLGYFNAISAAGLTILPNLVERVVIVPQFLVAGTPDNYVLCPDGKMRVLDKKTGNLDYAAIEFAVQLALYANAKAMRNYSTNSYEPLPEIATDYAIIAHVVPGTGKTELMRVNIRLGWAWARTCAEVMDIRKTKHVITPYIGTAAPLTNESFISSSQAQTVAVPPATPGISSTLIAEHLSSLDSTGLVEAACEMMTPTGPWLIAQEVLNREHDSSRRLVAAQIHRIDTVWAARGIPPLRDVIREINAHQSLTPMKLNVTGSVDAAAAGRDYGVASVVQAVDAVVSADNDTSALFYGTEEDSDPSPGGQDVSDPAPPESVSAAATPAPAVDAPASSLPTAPAAGSNNRLAADPAYLNHAIASLRVITGAEPLAHMDAHPYPGDVEKPPLTIDDPEAAAQALVDGARGKARLQQAAKDFAQLIRERTGVGYEFKLNQHQIKLARDMVAAAVTHNIDLPTFAPSSRSKAKPEQSDEDRKLTTQLEQIRRMPTVEGLTQYQATLGECWTDEHQQAARVRVEEINAAAAQQQTGLTVEQIIDGATSTQTLQLAWRKATNNNANPEAWTPELQARADAKSIELGAGQTPQQ